MDKIIFGVLWSLNDFFNNGNVGTYTPVYANEKEQIDDWFTIKSIVPSAPLKLTPLLKSLQVKN